MKNHKNKIIKQYLKKVMDYTACSKGLKLFYVQEMKQQLDSYLSDQPDLTLEYLHKALGTPEQFAVKLSERDEYSAALKRARKKYKIWMCVGIIFIVLFVIAVAVIIRLAVLYGGNVIVSDDFLRGIVK